MKQLLKSVVRRLPAGLTDPLFSYRQRRLINRIQSRQGLPQIFEACSRRYGLVVLDGPFKGMKYVSRAMASTGTPKLLGSYECELHPWITRLFENKYSQVIDVGCAEGYYAVGLAMKIPSSRVIAFDIDAVSQRLCRKMALLNGVADRVTVRGRCTIEGLRAAMGDNALLVCDCEGFEQDLLDPALIPNLRTADVLVELHDSFRPGLTRVITQRFADSHKIEIAEIAKRDPADYPKVSFLPPDQQHLALSEQRSGVQQWGMLTAISRRS